MSTDEIRNAANGVESGKSDPFEEIREHMEAAQEIAASNSDDAHVFRIVLALEREEEPAQADIDRLQDRVTDSGHFGRMVLSPSLSEGRKDELVRRVAAKLSRKAGIGECR